MDPNQDRLDQQAPEVVHPSYPEAVQHPFHYQPKPEDGTGTHTSSTTPYSNYASPVGHHAGAVGALPGDKSLGHGENHGRRNKGLLCGCTTLVFILSAIIAILAAAVVGLAVGTGVEANRANTAEAKVSSMSSSRATVTATTTVASASASSTSFADLDSNCSGNPSGVNGTTYNSFSCESSRYNYLVRISRHVRVVNANNSLPYDSDRGSDFYNTVQCGRAGEPTPQSLYQHSHNMHSMSHNLPASCLYRSVISTLTAPPKSMQPTKSIPSFGGFYFY